MRLLACIESPFRGKDLRVAAVFYSYLDAALHWAIRHNYTPVCGHAIYPRVLCDSIPAERELGIEMHLQLLRKCDVVLVFTDHGVSEGMQAGIALAQALAKPIVHILKGEVVDASLTPKDE